MLALMTSLPSSTFLLVFLLSFFTPSLVSSSPSATIPTDSSTTVTSSSASFSSTCQIWRYLYPNHEFATQVAVKPATAANNQLVSHIYASLRTDLGGALLIANSCNGKILAHFVLPAINSFAVSYTGLIFFTTQVNANSVTDQRDGGIIQNLNYQYHGKGSVSSSNRITNLVSQFVKLPEIDWISNMRMNDKGSLYALAWPSSVGLTSQLYNSPTLFIVDWSTLATTTISLGTYFPSLIYPTPSSYIFTSIQQFPSVFFWVKSATNVLTSNIIHDAYIGYEQWLLKLIYTPSNGTIRNGTVTVSKVNLDPYASRAAASTSITHRVVSENGDLFYIRDDVVAPNATTTSSNASLNRYDTNTNVVNSVPLSIGRAWNLTASSASNVAAVSFYHNETIAALQNPNEVNLASDELYVYDYDLQSSTPLWSIILSDFLSQPMFDSLPFISSNRHIQNIRLDHSHLFASITTRWSTKSTPLLSILAVFNATTGTFLRYFPLYTIPQSETSNDNQQTACELKAGPTERRNTMLYQCVNQLMLITPEDERWVVFVEDDFAEATVVSTQEESGMNENTSSDSSSFWSFTTTSNLLYLIIPLMFIFLFFVCCLSFYFIRRKRLRSLALLRDLEVASSMLTEQNHGSSQIGNNYETDTNDNIVSTNGVRSTNGNNNNNNNNKNILVVQLENYARRSSDVLSTHLYESINQGRVDHEKEESSKRENSVSSRGGASMFYSKNLDAPVAAELRNYVETDMSEIGSRVEVPKRTGSFSSQRGTTRREFIYQERSSRSPSRSSRASSQTRTGSSDLTASSPPSPAAVPSPSLPPLPSQPNPLQKSKSKNRVIRYDDDDQI